MEMYSGIAPSDRLWAFPLRTAGASCTPCSEKTASQEVMGLIGRTVIRRIFSDDMGFAAISERTGKMRDSLESHPEIRITSAV